MKKKRLLLCLTVLVILVSVASISMAGNLSKSKPFENADPIQDTRQLITASQNIVVGEIVGKAKEFEFDGYLFTKTKIRIMQTIKGSLAVQDTIHLLQYAERDAELSKDNGNIVLFLDTEYIGPITSERGMYFATGLQQGQYEVSKVNGKVKKAKKVRETVSESDISAQTITGFESIEELVQQVDSISNVKNPAKSK